MTVRHGAKAGRMHLVVHVLPDVTRGGEPEDPRLVRGRVPDLTDVRIGDLLGHLEQQRTGSSSAGASCSAG